MCVALDARNQVKFPVFSLLNREVGLRATETGSLQTPCTAIITKGHCQQPLVLAPAGSRIGLRMRAVARGPRRPRSCGTGNDWRCYFAGHGVFDATGLPGTGVSYYRRDARTASANSTKPSPASACVDQAGRASDSCSKPRKLATATALGKYPNIGPSLGESPMKV